jgi:hypothetical protein
MNMLGLSSSVHITHTACYWQFFLLHYIEVLCQCRLCKVHQAYLTYLMLQQQLSLLNGCKLDSRQVQDSYILCNPSCQSEGLYCVPLWLRLRACSWERRRERPMGCSRSYTTPGLSYAAIHGNRSSLGCTGLQPLSSVETNRCQANHFRLLMQTVHETGYAYHAIWGHLNGTLHKHLPLVILKLLK